MTAYDMMISTKLHSGTPSSRTDEKPNHEVTARTAVAEPYRAYMMNLVLKGMYIIDR